jgi:hypothetical protein
MGLEPWVSRIIGPPVAEDDPRMVESRQFIAEARKRGVDARCLSGSEIL